MSEIGNIADTELDKLLEYVDLGKFEIVESRTDRQDMLELLLGIMLAVGHHVGSSQ